VFLAVLPLAAAAEPPNTSAVRSLVDAPVPLVLKDGRIAQINLYAVPFPTGSAEPVPNVVEELDRLAAGWATDCFLSAQVIGHVAPGSGRDGDTLAAHRLARARADRLQAVLIGHGLPQKAIASVWDWQFFVPESRATLWVFALVPGEDCEGAALSHRAPEVESQSQPEAASGPVARLKIARDSGKAQEAEGSAMGNPAPDPPMAWAQESDSGSADGETAPSLSRATAEEGPEHLAAVKADSPSASATIASAEPSTAETAESQSEAPADMAARAAGSSQSPGAEPVGAALPTATAVTHPVAATPTRGLSLGVAAAQAPGSEEVVYEVQFDLNSSFLPQGAGAGLRAFLDRLGEGRFAIRLEGAVAGGDVANARTPEEARRYNEWITTRRVNRVREWLERHAAGRIVTIEQELVQDDPSRRVVIRARRLP
jgi:hypothetical protein